MNDPGFLMKKERIGLAAVICWILVFLIEPGYFGLALGLFLPLGWLLTVIWIGMDAGVRGRKTFWWVVFAIITGPVAVLIYVLTAPTAKASCYRCCLELRNQNEPCAICGYQTYFGKFADSVRSLLSSLVGSLSSESTEKAAHTARYMCIAFAAFALFIRVLASHSLGFLAAISFAAYWVLAAWWVYLDATWRRMEAVPWAVLTLLTNLFGLVTYLVVRYPEPKHCQKCGAALSNGLKCCPYCGSDAEMVCPQCQAPIQKGWIYCASCAMKLPEYSSEDVRPTAQTITIHGNVVDGSTGRPIEFAEVKIDSKSNTLSAVTDEKGGFVLAGLRPRPYVIIASAEGYSASSGSYTPGTGRVNFKLYPDPHPQERTDCK